MLLDLESLRCFEAAARARNFRRAASEVGLSPTAFSDRIARLEDQLNIALFERSTRHIALTAAGLRLLPVAQRTLESARQCVHAARDAHNHPPYELTLGTRFELGLSWLVPALQPLQLAKPERTLHLRFGDSADLLRQLQAGTVDAVISSVRFASGNLQFAPLHEEDYVFVAHTDLIAQKPMNGPQDAPQHTLIDAHPDLPLFRYLLETMTQAPLWTFARTELVGTIAAIRLRVLQGVGVAVLPRYFVRDDLANGLLLELMPDVQLGRDQFRLIWATNNPLRAEIAALADELRHLELR